jgi:hypothetical protein
LKSNGKTEGRLQKAGYRKQMGEFYRGKKDDPPSLKLRRTDGRGMIVPPPEYGGITMTKDAKTVNG